MIIFATIFGVGFLILLISLIFGHDFDHDVDLSGDVDADVGHGPNFFSARMLALFMVGFGAVGFGVRTTTDWNTLEASMAGLGGAAVIGALGWIVLRLFYSSQSSSTIQDSDVVGITANVIDAIAGKEYGQVSCVIRGREITFMARSKDGANIDRNTPVKVLRKDGNIVTVESA